MSPDPVSTSSPSLPSAPASAATHVVTRGQTLTRIASEYGVPLADLIQANPSIRNPDLIHPGQNLSVPPRGADAPPPQTTHVVQRGETLSGIAQQHGTGLSQLIAANPEIRNPNLIVPGQVVRVPGGGEHNHGHTDGGHNHGGQQPQGNVGEPGNVQQPGNIGQPGNVGPQGPTAGPSGVVAADHGTQQGGVSYRFESNPPRGAGPSAELLTAIREHRTATADAIPGIYAWRHFGESNFHGHPEGAAVDFGLNPVNGGAGVGVEPPMENRLAGEALSAWLVTHTGPDLPFRQVIFRNGNSVTAGHHDHVHVNYNLDYRGGEIPVPPADLVQRYLAGEYGPLLSDIGRQQQAPAGGAVPPNVR